MAGIKNQKNILKLFILSGISLYLVSIFSPILSAASPWPMFRHDQQRTGRTENIGPGDAKILFSYSADGSIRSSVALDEQENLYFGCDSGRFFSLNPDGSFRWQYNTLYPIQSSPAVDELTRVFVGNNQSYLYAFDGNTGSVIWTKYLGAPVRSSPLVANNGIIYVVVGSDNQGIYALNADNGYYIWATAVAGKVISSPALSHDGQTVYVGVYHYQGKIYALNANDGTIQWSFSADGAIQWSTPAVGSDGTIYIGSQSGNLYAIEDQGTSAVLKWVINTGSTIESSPAIGKDDLGNDKIIYIMDTLYGLKAIDAATGTLKWSLNPPYGTSSPAIDGEGTIYVGSYDNLLYAIKDEGTSGKVLWTLQTDDKIYASPAIGTGNTLFI